MFQPNRERDPKRAMPCPLPRTAAFSKGGQGHLEIESAQCVRCGGDPAGLLSPGARAHRQRAQSRPRPTRPLGAPRPCHGAFGRKGAAPRGLRRKGGGLARRPRPRVRSPTRRRDTPPARIAARCLQTPSSRRAPKSLCSPRPITTNSSGNFFLSSFMTIKSNLI